MKSENNKHSEKDLQRIKALRIADDNFMTIYFDDFIEGAELILKIILDRDDLVVKEVKTQEQLNNVIGRSAILDIYAVDLSNKNYDVEIQRANKGASLKRARYHSSLITVNMLDKGEAFDSIRDCYVIFITENDVFGRGEPIYHIDKTIH